MVRKRPLKHEESDDDDSEDSDYVPDEVAPAPKRYSLRTRTKQTFVDEFDYEVDSDESPARRRTDDEDFELEPHNDHLAFVNYVQARAAQEEVSKTLQDPENFDLSNGLIDFEDIIRADIVINNKRIPLHQDENGSRAPPESDPGKSTKSDVNQLQPETQNSGDKSSDLEGRVNVNHWQVDGTLGSGSDSAINADSITKGNGTLAASTVTETLKTVVADVSDSNDQKIDYDDEVICIEEKPVVIVLDD